jgi:hypothetical protein
MSHSDACVWCGKLVVTSHKPNVKQDVVCSDKCKQCEYWFRMTYSDERIGLRNFEEHGVNPNNRGKR